MINPIFKKPAGVRYVDMAIYIDKHFYEEDRDEDTLFIYMVNLAIMLARQKKYFKNNNDYEGFAFYLATDVWKRMTTDKVKSVLNYMKAVLYFRKCSYEHESYSQMIDPEFDKNWDTSQYISVNTDKLESKNRDVVIRCVNEEFELLPKLVRKSLPKLDKVTREKVYKSALLTLIYRATVPNEKEDYKNERLESQPKFNSSNFYRTLLKDDRIILWHLPQSQSDVVRLVINSTMNKLLSELKDIIDDSKISEREYRAISASAFDGALTNEN